MPFVALREGPAPDRPPAPLQLAYFSTREIDEQAGRPVRATLPRYRYDQLMAIGWKLLIPLAIANLVVTGIVKVMLL